jgi:alkylation response protein AidB-like acyl-CoA dehydrogenase
LGPCQQPEVYDRPVPASPGEMTIDDARRHVDALLNELLRTHPPATTGRTEFLRAQYDLGLAWIHFDVGCGGLGLAPSLQYVVAERINAAGGPSAWEGNPIGLGMAGPTVHTWASTDHKHRYLRPMFTGEEIWCQLFSEPGAGSDVAGLATSAVRDGDEWVLNGQKVWASLGHLARRALIVARTDPEAPKHAGLSYFVLDMTDPGVAVRPLRQMTGDAEFNEIYLTDARIPDSERLGAVGDGWRVSLTTLMNERVSIGGIFGGTGGPVGEAMAIWSTLPAERRGRVQRDQLMRLYIEGEAIRHTLRRAAEGQARGIPGPEGSTAKLAASELGQRAYAFCMGLLGADAMLTPGYNFDRQAQGMPADIRQRFLRSRAFSIEGGTSEIQRNILAERVLGLPGDVRVDKDIAWNLVPRN